MSEYEYSPMSEYEYTPFEFDEHQFRAREINTAFIIAFLVGLFVGYTIGLGSCVNWGLEII